MTNTSKDWSLLGNSSPTRRVATETYLANQVRLKFSISILVFFIVVLFKVVLFKVVCFKAALFRISVH